jgi:predicted DNA-binding protein YlxM (UPF0122 family)
MGYSLEETIKLNQLYDIYNQLLTDKQREYFSYYFKDNYSLSEIAEILAVSRNAVHLQIKNVVKNLEELDIKLGIIEQNKKISKLLKALEKEKLNGETMAIIKEIEKVK